MKVLQVHNQHRFGGGSELVAASDTRLLRNRGHDILFLGRDSRQLGQGLFGKMRAFVCGIYCGSGRALIARHIRDFKPDIVHVH